MVTSAISMSEPRSRRYGEPEPVPSIALDPLGVLHRGQHRAGPEVLEGVVEVGLGAECVRHRDHECGQLVLGGVAAGELARLRTACPCRRGSRPGGAASAARRTAAAPAQAWMSAGPTSRRVSAVSTPSAITSVVEGSASLPEEDRALADRTVRALGRVNLGLVARRGIDLNGVQGDERAFGVRYRGQQRGMRDGVRSGPERRRVAQARRERASQFAANDQVRLARRALQRQGGLELAAQVEPPLAFRPIVVRALGVGSVIGVASVIGIGRSVGTVRSGLAVGLLGFGRVEDLGCRPLPFAWRRSCPRAPPRDT